MRGGFRLLVCAAMAAAAEARAADLSAVFTYQQSSILYGNLREAEPAAFWDLFTLAFSQRAPRMFEDQFTPLNFRTFNSLSDGNVRHLPDDDPGMARRAFSGAFRSSAQEAVLEL